ncbi:MAG: hypothetical protein L6Q49_20850 [Anaerolineales bacterium]|nr:hypothetical protein [Anaerolineales bacterium]
MKTTAFIILSAILLFISHKSLRSPRSHGFYRFFAWECMLGLFLLNVTFWFYKPLAWNQLIAWALLLVSLVPLGLGIYELRTKGKPAGIRNGDNSLLGFEKTTQLVVSGVYRYIRHPLYCSLLFLTWGIFFKQISAMGVLLAVLATTLLILTAKTDEAECIHFFGTQYQEYMKTTKMLIPFLF